MLFPVQTAGKHYLSLLTQYNSKKYQHSALSCNNLETREVGKKKDIRMLKSQARLS